MYKKFRKNLDKSLIPFLNTYNFQYLKKDKKFIGFYEDLVFEFSFHSYLSNTTLRIDKNTYVPKLLDNILIPDNKTYYPYVEYVADLKWNFKKNFFKNTEKIDEKIGSYIDDIKYIFEHYFFNIIANEINTFSMEKYIYDEYIQEYDNYLHRHNIETESWIYTVKEFINKGREQDEWTEEDQRKTDVMDKKQREELFPYPIIKEKILKKIENNTIIYEAIIAEYIQSKYDFIKINENVKGVRLDKFLNQTSSGKHIKDVCHKFGYITEKKHFGREDEITSYINDKINSSIEIVLKKELFLEFNVFSKDKHTERISFYKGDSFSFGWLIGDPNLVEKKITNAIEALVSYLKNDN